ncbi:MAG: S8 family serine peptidase [Cyclobacteriaceae bacterium]
MSRYRKAFGASILIMIIFLLTTYQSIGQVVLSDKIVVKFRTSEKALSSSSINAKEIFLEDLSSAIALRKVDKLLFNKSANSRTVLSTKKSVLEGIYYITLEESESVEEAVAKLSNYDNIQYAEPIKKQQLLFSPNDPSATAQSALSVIKAFEAWDVTQGSEEIIIGISDTGVQLDHVDLADNIFLNEADPINGIDDDGNGYVDDFNGWDFADGDNDPTADQSGHGTHVAGLSSATTNNGVGMAGVGFNCKFSSLKIFASSSGFLINGYESIIYAADQGYDIINLSWGSLGGYSQFEQDVVEYAALENGLVIVAAGGNGHGERIWYPASYDYVLSVANTDMSDNKSPGASFSYHIDISAPGMGVYTTSNGNQYNTDSGSSFSSPQAAGAAGLVKSVFPDYTSLQIIEQLRVTADDVYDVGSNSDYLGQLGKGRLNVYEAVSKFDAKSVRLKDFSYANSFGQYAFYDDTVTVSLSFTNYLNPTASATVMLSTENPNVSIPNPEIELGALGELDETAMITTQLVISEQAEHSERIVIRMDYEDIGYADFEYFEFSVSPYELDIDNSKLNLNLSKKGDVGFPQVSSSDYGITFNGQRVGKSQGIMVGNHPDSISDNVVANFSSLSREQDFASNGKIKFHTNSDADWYTRSKFDDSSADKPLGLTIEQEALSWNDEQNNEFIILEYRITNTTNNAKEDLNFGFYGDWELGTSSTNKSSWDAEDKLAYSYSNDETMYFGVALLSSHSPTVHSIDLGSEHGNVAELNNSFTNQDKFDFMTSEKLLAGELGDGNDIAQMLSAQVGSLEANASTKVALVLVGGETLTQLKENVAKAKLKYEEFVVAPPIEESFEVCANVPFVISPQGGNTFEVFDDIQMTNLLVSGADLEISALADDSLLYIRSVQEAFISDLYRIQVDVQNPDPMFTMSTDTLYLGDSDINKVSFTDLSGDAASWSWSFGNGVSTTVQNPEVIFNEAGLFDIDFQIASQLGCIGALSKELLVAERSPVPIISDQTICRGGQVEILADNSTQLSFYANEDDLMPAYEGESLIIENLGSDTLLYISSSANVFESHKVETRVNTSHSGVNFQVLPDTLDLSAKNRVTLVDLSTDATAYDWYIDNNLVSSEKTAHFNFTDETELEIKLRVSNSMGCLDSLSKTIELQVSATPSVQDTLICKFDEISIVPGNGELFYFYDNTDLMTPIHKGNTFKTKKIESPTTYYVTGVDGYKESEATGLSIEIIPFEGMILADPDTLILSEARNVTFSNTNQTETSNQRWYIGDEFVESVATPSLFFDKPGLYDVMLVSQNAVGCQDTTNLSYKVLNVPITALSDDVSEELLIYPNPSSGSISIEHTKPLRSLLLYNSSGRLVKNVQGFPNQTSFNIDLSSFSSGLFFLKAQFENRTVLKKIILLR